MSELGHFPVLSSKFLTNSVPRFNDYLWEGQSDGAIPLLLEAGTPALRPLTEMKGILALGIHVDACSSGPQRPGRGHRNYGKSCSLRPSGLCHQAPGFPSPPQREFFPPHPCLCLGSHSFCMAGTFSALRS